MADQDVGVTLIVVGAVIMVVAILFPPLCLLGILLLLIGIILAAATPRHPTYYAPPPYPYPPQPQPWPQPPAATPSCSVCGTALTWVAQYNRWYCMRCQAYR